MLIATMIASFLTLGPVQAFGVFQAHLSSEDAVRDGLLRPQQIQEKSLIALIGSLANGGIVALFGIWFVPKLPWIGSNIKYVCLAGSLLMSFSMAIGMASTELWHLLLSEGLAFGVGSGIVANTLPSILPEYFSTKSGLAQGFVAAAGGMGGVFYSKLGDVLLTQRTQTAFLMFSLVGLYLSIFSTLLAQPARNVSRRKTTMVDWSTLKNPSFCLFMVVNLLVPLTLRTPTSFGPIFGKSMGLSPSKAASIHAWMSLVGIPTRLVVGTMADKAGHQNTCLLMTALCAATVLVIWLPAALTGNQTMWTVFMMGWGLINGTFLQLINSVGQRLFGPELYYSYNGTFTSLRGLGFVMGGPLAGALLRHKTERMEPRQFLPVIVCTGLAMLASTVSLVYVRILDAKKQGWKWAR
ncbi:MFS general substrate transporter [Aaosphaeria arxii CBS 175.79]|uniref:MFS general substrate transporter n=1 Tax=Aaosphaeria arxii CBS 175.79 TaxID=1450172 RepID=A0A6A5XWT8_9PLEO|nr:MFS general substrate transporter [Aaosphaeria arxii CBS 175.79]KAF2017419.1 MFS general substrate transporter [Aaosphaeria arxii CBS 175.79]